MLLEAQQRAVADAVRKSIVAGAVMTGRVASVRDFGAFIDLGGGVQGLLHVSEMGWSRVEDMSQVLKAGDEITVKVLRDDDGEDLARGEAAVGGSVVTRGGDLRSRTGAHRQVTSHRLRAFVELEPGIEAWRASSTFTPTGRSGGWSSQVAIGMTAAFEILSIDADKKRIGVALLPEGSARAGGNRLSASEIVPGADSPASSSVTRNSASSSSWRPDAPA